MKNLSHYKKQVRASRQRHTHERAQAKIESICKKVFAESDKRWDAMQLELKQQRLKLGRQINIRRYGKLYPLIQATTAIMADVLTPEGEMFDIKTVI